MTALVERILKAAIDQVRAWDLVILTQEIQSGPLVEIFCAPKETGEGSWAIRLDVESSEYMDGCKFSAQPMMNFGGWTWSQFLRCHDDCRVSAIQKWSTSACQAHKSYLPPKPDDRFIEAILYTYEMTLTNRARQATLSSAKQELCKLLGADGKGRFMAPNAEGFVKTTFNNEVVVNLSISTPNIEKIKKILDILKGE